MRRLKKPVLATSEATLLIAVLFEALILFERQSSPKDKAVFFFLVIAGIRMYTWFTNVYCKNLYFCGPCFSRIGQPGHNRGHHISRVPDACKIFACP